MTPQDDTDGPVDDVLASIEILCSKAVRGQQCCDSILSSYRISKVNNRVFPIFVQIAVEFVELDEFYRMISSVPGYCKQYSGIPHHEKIQYLWKIVYG